MLARVTVTIDRKTGLEKSRKVESLPDEQDDIYRRLAEILAPRVIKALSEGR
jgi:hypothetical protein